MSMPENEKHWAEAALGDFANEFMKERKRKRRWSIFFKSIFALLILLVIVSNFVAKDENEVLMSKPHTALIDIKGPIFDMGKSNADNVVKSLQRAFKAPGAKGIILRINSPGGSPVQADYIYQEIIRLKKQNPKIKVYSVCTDLCASAAYYIAAAGDYIYANPSSLVGSIGVLFNGFGFVGVMDKVGVERRLITSGKYKGFMDPFSPRNEAEEERLKVMLDTIHAQFIERVKTGRGKRLASDSDIFSGLFWTGEKAKTLGLIDDFSTAGRIARDMVKAPKVLDYTDKPNYFEKIMKQIGASASGELADRMGLNANSVVQS